MGERTAGAKPLSAPNISGLDAATGVRRKSAVSISWKLWLVAAWLVFSVALAVWWLIFGLQQSARLTELAGSGNSALTTEIAREVTRQHRMLLSEGVTLVVLLFLGGAALLWSIGTDLKRARRIQEFLGAFTHDLKTSLSSLRLQTEALEEDLKDSGQARLARRLVKDTVRLELQLENSLALAAPESESPLLMEPLELGELLQMLSNYWPDLIVLVDGQSVVSADRRAVESIFKNLAQNAVVHGRASRVQIDVVRAGPWTRVRFTDDGRGFHGNYARLGRMFERHSSSSGSGLGLSLAMKLASRMGGGLTVIEIPAGFAVEVLLPSSVVPDEGPA